jgi:hypothetical protein
MLLLSRESFRFTPRWYVSLMLLYDSIYTSLFLLVNSRTTLVGAINKNYIPRERIVRAKSSMDDDGPVEADKVIQAVSNALDEDKHKEATNERVIRLRNILNERTAVEVQPKTVNLLEV